MITEKKWEERIRDPHAECMSEEERRILQGEKLRKLVKRVYGTVPFYTEKMKELGVEPGDIKSIEDITKLPFTTKDDLRDNYPFGFLADIRNNRETNGDGIHPEGCGCLGRMCGTLSDNGRTDRQGSDSCLLWIRPVYRRNGA